MPLSIREPADRLRTLLINECILTSGLLLKSSIRTEYIQSIASNLIQLVCWQRVDKSLFQKI